MARFLVKLGYDACAFNVSATAPLGRHHRCASNDPIPSPQAERSISGAMSEASARGRGEREIVDPPAWKALNTHHPPLPPPIRPCVRFGRCQLTMPDLGGAVPSRGALRVDATPPFRMLSRITVTVEDSVHVANLDGSPCPPHPPRAPQYPAGRLPPSLSEVWGGTFPSSVLGRSIWSEQYSRR